MSLLPDSIMDTLKNIQEQLEVSSQKIIYDKEITNCGRGCIGSCYVGCTSESSGCGPTCGGRCASSGPGNSRF